MIVTLRNNVIIGITILPDHGDVDKNKKKVCNKGEPDEDIPEDDPNVESAVEDNKGESDEENDPNVESAVEDNKEESDDDLLDKDG